VSEPQRAGRQLRPSPHCLNCGAAVATRFCPHCGQENTTYRVSLQRLVGDLFDEVFQLESRLWRTLWALIRRPGLLTREYNAGRRVSYTTPLRLYLFSSVVYFFVAAVMPARVGSTAEVRVDLAEQKVDVNHLAPPKNWFDRRLRERLGITDKLDPVETTRRARELFVSNVPKALAVLVPLLALVLMLFFRGRFYVEHLVFSLHLHAFFFVVGTAVELSRIRVNGVVAPLVTVGWSWAALHAVYEQSWARTAWKTLLIAMLYSALVIVGLLAAVLVGVVF